MNTRLPAMTLALGLLGTLPAAWTAERAVAVDQLTVYADGLEVVRRLSLTASRGPFEMTVDDLPAGVHVDSVRVTGSAGITRLGITTRPDRAPARPEALREAGYAAMALAREREGLERQLAWLERVAAPTASGEATHGLPFSETGDFVLREHARIASALARIDRETARLREEQDRLTEPHAAAMRDAARPRLHLSGEQRGPGPGTVRLTYRRSTGGWQPGYDLALDRNTNTGRLALSASIAPTDMPALRVGALAVVSGTMDASAQPTALPGLAVRLTRSPPTAPGNADAVRVAVIDGRLDPRHLPGAVSAPTDAPISADGAVRLPDGTGHSRITLFERSVAATTRLVLAPDASTVGREELTLRNDTEHVLPTGPLAISRTDRHGTRAQLPSMGPGTTTVLPLGADGRLRVERTLVARDETDTGAHRVISLALRVLIHNHDQHERTVHLRVRHPTGSKEDPVAVSDLYPAVAGGEDVRHDPKTGRLEWVLRIPPGAGAEATVFEYGYRLTLDRNFRLVAAGGG